MNLQMLFCSKKTVLDASIKAFWYTNLAFISWLKNSIELKSPLNIKIKSDNFCYRKVGRAVNKWRAVEKSLILLSQYWNNDHFDRVPKSFRILGAPIIFSSIVLMVIWFLKYSCIRGIIVCKKTCEI